MNKQFIAVAATLFNFTIPGLGSMLGGRLSVGSKQLVLTGVAALLLYLNVPEFQVGLAAAAAWLWALTTSIEFLKGAYDK
jgi:TM2 domain-containing membrane protein YozV